MASKQTCKVPGCESASGRNRLSYCRRHWNEAVSQIVPIKKNAVVDDEYTDADLAELGVAAASPAEKQLLPEVAPVCACASSGSGAVEIVITQGVLTIAVHEPRPEQVALLVSAALEGNHGNCSKT